MSIRIYSPVCEWQYGSNTGQPRSAKGKKGHLASPTYNKGFCFAGDGSIPSLFIRVQRQAKTTPCAISITSNVYYRVVPKNMTRLVHRQSDHWLLDW